MRRQPQGTRARQLHYIVVCWRDGSPQDAWRFALVDPRNGQRRPFLALAALCRYLSAQLDRGDDT